MPEHDSTPERDVHHEVDPQVDPRKVNPHERDRPERRRAGH
jgi:hypothetical protein